MYIRRVRLLPAGFLALGLWIGPGAAAPTPARADAPAVWDGKASRKEVDAAVAEYFDAKDERRAEIRAMLDGLGALSEADAKTWAKTLLKEADRRGPKFPAKSGETWTLGSLKGPVFTAGKPAKNGAMLVALHGGGAGVGDGQEAMQKWQFVAGKAFVIAPTTPDKRDSAWCAEDVEAWVLALIDAAVRTYDLDTNRVWLAGHSMGGYGTWSIGCRHADRFAALSACAGGIFMMVGGGEPTLAPGHVPNLLDTPIWFYNSTDDKQVSCRSSQLANAELKRWKEAGYPYVWTYDEYGNIGHGLPPKGLKPIGDWLVERVRNPYPKRVVFEPSRKAKRRLFWLATDSDARVEGKIEGNTVTIGPEGRASGVTVHLNASLVDVTKPVTVVADGKPVFEGPVPPRLSVLLDTIATGRDPKQFFDRAVTIP